MGVDAGRPVTRRVRVGRVRRRSITFGGVPEGSRSVCCGRRSGQSGRGAGWDASGARQLRYDVARSHR